VIDNGMLSASSPITRYFRFFALFAIGCIRPLLVVITQYKNRDHHHC